MRLRGPGLAGLSLLPLTCDAVSLTAGVEYFDHDYIERDDAGVALVTEAGSLPGIVLAVDHRFASGLGTGVRYWVSSGDTDYRGRTQGGQPLATVTEQDFRQVAIALNYRFARQQFTFTPQVQVTDWQWQRRITATPASLPLGINYDWQQIAIGVEVAYQVPWGELSFDWDYLENRDISARIDLRAAGLGFATVAPRADRGNRIQLANEFRFGDSWAFSQYLFFERQGFRASDPVSVPAGTGAILIHEPESETERGGIGLELRYEFGNR